MDKMPSRILQLEERVKDQRKKLSDYRELTSKQEDDIFKLEVELKETMKFIKDVSKEKDQIETKFEKSKQITDKVIKSLKDEKQNLVESFEELRKNFESEQKNAFLYTKSEQENEVNKLLKEIAEMAKENEEKEIMLKKSEEGSFEKLGGLKVAETERDELKLMAQNYKMKLSEC